MLSPVTLIGPREARLLRQNMPNPESMPQVTTPDEASDTYQYMAPEQIRAIDVAREERLAPLRAKEAASREEDQRQLPLIEAQMNKA